jgi:hypothetical protein
MYCDAPSIKTCAIDLHRPGQRHNRRAHTRLRLGSACRSWR